MPSDNFQHVLLERGPQMCSIPSQGLVSTQAQSSIWFYDIPSNNKNSAAAVIDIVQYTDLLWAKGFAFLKQLSRRTRNIVSRREMNCRELLVERTRGHQITRRWSKSTSSHKPDGIIYQAIWETFEACRKYLERNAPTETMTMTWYTWSKRSSLFITFRLKQQWEVIRTRDAVLRMLNSVWDRVAWGCLWLVEAKSRWNMKSWIRSTISKGLTTE